MFVNKLITFHFNFFLFVYLQTIYLMAIVPGGSTWVARWGVQPQLMSRASSTSKSFVHLPQ